MKMLADSMSGAQHSAHEAEARAQQASAVAEQHAAALEGVSQTSRELAALADRLQQSIARFQVHRAEAPSVRTTPENGTSTDAPHLTKPATHGSSRTGRARARTAALATTES